MRCKLHIFGLWADVFITGTSELMGDMEFWWLPALEDDGQEIRYIALSWRWDSATSFSHITNSHWLIQARQPDSMEATCGSHCKLSFCRADSAYWRFLDVR